LVVTASPASAVPCSTPAPAGAPVRACEDCMNAHLGDGVTMARECFGQAVAAGPVNHVNPQCAQYTLPSDIQVCNDEAAGAPPPNDAMKPYLPPGLGGTR
jgi:hypothetical protein